MQKSALQRRRTAFFAAGTRTLEICDNEKSDRGTLNDSTSDTLTFYARGTSRAITVSVIGETVKESNETFVVSLRNAIGAEIADGQGLGAIQNDDGKPPKTSASSASLVQAVPGDSLTPSAKKAGATSVQQTATRQKRP